MVQLRNADPTRVFEPSLEAEYVRHHLARHRTLIRVVSSLAVLLTLAQTIEQAAAHALTSTRCLHAALGLVASILISALSWSRRFDTLYLPSAEFLVPIRNATAAASFAQAAHGHPEVLMTVPLMLISPFFFLGLRYRASMLTAALVTGYFIVGAILGDLPLPVVIHSSAYLIVTLIALAIAARQLERGSRTSFIESRLAAEVAQLDPLTGIKNRRVLDQHLACIWQQAAERHRAVAFLLIDVDHFKAYNDRYGHLAGDDVLRKVAQALQHLVHRPMDILARYGGEEFAVTLYDVDGPAAAQIAENMRRAILALGIEHHAAQRFAQVTVSIGVAAIEPTLQRDPRGALQLADEALYTAKLAGRNCVELMDETQYQHLSTGVFSTAVPKQRPPQVRELTDRLARDF